MLELKGVSKRFDATQALEPTNLSVGSGETTVLIGPSGCGKSTLLRLMVGLIWPDTGQVYFDGALISPVNILLFRRRMGYVIQDGGLFPHLSARANVTLMARFLQWEPAKIDGRLTDLAGLTRLPLDVLEKYPVQLSGGQRQRVGLMRALMLDPAVLLLDEPLGALDPITRADLQSDLRRIFQTLNKTVVLVTHDIGEAGFFGKDIVLLRAGAVVQRGTLADLLRCPADPFVSRFINAQRNPFDAMGENRL